MDALGTILDDLYDPEADLDIVEPFPAPPPPFESRAERAERERRDARERQRRSRANRRTVSEMRERTLAEREADVAAREAELETRALDTTIVDALREVLSHPYYRERMTSAEGLRSLRLSVQSLFSATLCRLIEDQGRDKGEAVRVLNDRLLR